MDRTEPELLERAQRGDMQAFADLFEPLRPAVTAVARQLVGSNDAEDVAMETFLKAWQALPGFRGRSSLKIWLYRIAHNAGVDMLRSRRRETVPLIQDPSEGEGLDPASIPDTNQPGPDTLVSQRETAARVRQALMALPEEHRTALGLRYVDGLSYAEIAAATGTGMGTVMSRLFYGKRKLMKLLEGSVNT